MRQALLHAAVAAAVAVALPGAAQTPAPVSGPVRSEVPIREVVLSDGQRRYGVPVSVGATAVEAGLDSGSPGLRVLPGVLQPGDAQAGGGSVSISYGAGAKLDGPVGQATVTIGGVSGRVGLQLISKVGCDAQQPRCAAGRIPLAQYGIQGNGLPGEGFKAILGVNTADDATPSILRALKVRRWIIELPRPGESAPGRLVLNPTDQEAAGFAMMRRAGRFSAEHGGLHDAVEGCLQNAADGQQVCGAVLMDTGAPGVVVESDDAKSIWPSGTPAVLALAQDGKVVASARFETDRRAQASRLTFRAGHGSHGEGGGPTVIYAGLLPYFAWSVLYDPSADAIGVKPRPPAPGGPTPSPGA